MHEQIRNTGIDPWKYDGVKCSDTIKELELCLEKLSNPECEAYFRKFDSPNGWGNLFDSREFIRHLIKLAKNRPNAYWHTDY